MKYGKSGFSFMMSDRGGQILVGLLVVAIVAVPILNLAVPPSSPFHVPTFVVSLLGKYLAFAFIRHRH